MDYLEIAQAILAVIGGLKIICRYTKTKADDRILEQIEKPLKWIIGFLSFKRKK